MIRNGQGNDHAEVLLLHGQIQPARIETLQEFLFFVVV